jgi:hypothetical protein
VALHSLEVKELHYEGVLQNKKVVETHYKHFVIVVNRSGGITPAELIF